VFKSFLALVAGALNVLAFAPFGYWPVSMLSFAILFWIWLECSAGAAAWFGFLYGLGMFGVGISWMYISIHTFGGMPPLIAGFCIFVLVACLSFYPAICGWIQSTFSSWSPSARLIFLMPSLWIVLEWLRGWLFSGLPWLSAGYPYIDTPLSNLAPIGGVYLVGLVALVSVGCLLALSRRPNLSNSVLAAVLAIVWIAGWQLNETSWTMAEGDPISVAVIQNNVPLMEKWDEQESNKIISDYMRVSQKHRDVDLVIWPEAAVPDYLDKLANEFWNDIESHPADFLLGTLYRDKVEGSYKYYNSVVAVSDRIMIYRKHHLVPFGEYFPMQGLLAPLINLLNIPMSDFTSWEQPQAPLIAAENRFAVSICFEDAFPGEWRSQVAPAGILVNVSEDIWFGDSFAPHQRLQMARFRSRESERPMIRSSNNGLSSLINWKGGIDQYAPQFARHVVTGSVQPRSGVTPYIAFGEKPVLSLAGVLLFMGLIFGREKSGK
jgi:apolipoprotein N-acyltransferase